MSDYRSALYESYVSTFKGDPHAATDLPRLFAYFDIKYKPLLDDLPRTARLMELGCGPGHFLMYLKSLGFTDVRGIDISAEQVALAVRAGCTAEVADVFDVLEASPGRFDAMFALDFVEHFDKAQLSRLGRGLAGALADRGRLILQTPNGSGLFVGQIACGDLTHGTIFNESSIRQWLVPFGFGDFEFREAGPAGRDFRGRIRTMAWKILRLGLNCASKIANGRTSSVWTDNMIVRGDKVARTP
jgi:SAM-dependent methyltransferase